MTPALKTPPAQPRRTPAPPPRLTRDDVRQACAQLGVDGDWWLDARVDFLGGRTPAEVVDSENSEDEWYRDELRNRLGMMREGLFT